MPKNLNNPFFDQAKLGCEKAVDEIGADKVECLFTGPGEHGGGDEQVQIVADLIAKGVDGIAVAAVQRRRHGERRCATAQGGEHPGADLGQRPAARGQGASRSPMSARTTTTSA